jgi:hypothetical protein
MIIEFLLFKDIKKLILEKRFVTSISIFLLGFLRRNHINKWRKEQQASVITNTVICFLKPVYSLCKFLFKNF